MTIQVLVTAVAVICILIIISRCSFLKFFKKKEKKPMKKEEDNKVEKGPVDQIDDAASMFMVTSDEETKEEKKAPLKKKRVYRPGGGSGEDTPEVIESVSADTEHFRGHEVEVKELPKAKEVKIDASWIEMDVSKDYKIIVKELKRKKVNCYSILNIHRNADSKTIHKAYRKLASQYHPGRPQHPSSSCHNQHILAHQAGSCNP